MSKAILETETELKLKTKSQNKIKMKAIRNRKTITCATSNKYFWFIQTKINLQIIKGHHQTATVIWVITSGW